MKQKNELPSWRTDNIWAFAVSLMISAFAFAGLYYGLSNKIDLLVQRVDFYLEKTNTNYTSLQSMQQKYSSLKFDVGRCCPSISLSN